MIAEPGHPAALGVIVYTAVPAPEVVAVSVCAITVPELAEAPVTFVCVTVQLNVVPLTLLLNTTELALFEQIVCALGVAVAEGVGFTVTVAVIGAPLQVPRVGVMVYTAVPAAAPVADNVWVMLVPDPALAPLTPVCVTVQAKVAPPEVLLSAMELAPPEQMLCELGVAVAVGMGFTVTVTMTLAPAQVPAVGVMV